MLINFGFRNFFSFKEESFISFELDKNTPQNISHGRPCSTILGIKGANSSGKTNIIKALSFLREFVLTSSKQEKYKLPVSPFMGSKDSTHLHIEFYFSETQYKYELEIKDKEVISEKVSRKNKKWTPILTRHGSEITHAIKELDSAREIKTQNNSSIISTLSNFKFFDDLKDLKNIHAFFEGFYSNVTSDTGYYQFEENVERMSEFYYKHTQVFDFVNAFLKSSDMSIKEIAINKDVNSKGDEIYRPVFRHIFEDTTWDLSYSEQSSGTKHLYMTLGLYWGALKTNGILALDEFDIHLHAMLLPTILRLFEDTDCNPGNAQFIFTSHNTDIIDKLGKYRTILVNKEESESYCYRLDEIGGQILRNDRPISAIYKKGVIGGVPKL